MNINMNPRTVFEVTIRAHYGGFCESLWIKADYLAIPPVGTHVILDGEVSSEAMTVWLDPAINRCYVRLRNAFVDTTQDALDLIERMEDFAWSKKEPD